MIRRQLLESLVEPAWPVDVDVNGSGGPQAEMQTGVVAGKKAGLAQHSLRLGLIPVMDQNSGSNGTAVRLDTLQFHLDPMIRLAGEVIAQQRRGLVQINDQDVDIAVVVEVSKRASPTTVGRRHARSCIFDEFFKDAVAQMSKNGARCFVGILRESSFHLRVNMAGHHEKIWKTIIVQIDNARSPTDVSGFDSNARGSRRIIEITFSIIVVKNVGVIQKMRLE